MTLIEDMRVWCIITGTFNVIFQNTDKKSSIYKNMKKCAECSVFFHFKIQKQYIELIQSFELNPVVFILS